MIENDLQLKIYCRDCKNVKRVKMCEKKMNVLEKAQIFLLE